MAQTVNKVHQNTLSFQQGDKTVSIAVGSPQWFDWLAKATSFSYSGHEGNFTARKELIGSPHKSWYWKAYRKANGKLHRYHLGKDSGLTAEQLSRAARELTAKLLSGNGQIGAPLPLPAIEEALVVTKFHIPQNRHALTRSRLLAPLQYATNARLILVSAPPGFGKTTLVSGWLLALGESKSGWFSLDEADNDPVRFWRYFGQALARLPLASAQEQDWLDLPPNLAIDQLLAHLINRLVGLEEDIFLVLDDYHLISNEVIGQQLAFFLDRMSDRCHLIMISRTEPPLPLPRLRARNQIIEITAADLRFTSEEISHYLATVMNQPLSAKQVEALEANTEGWIAALQMLAISLKGQEDPDKIIASFSGAHHYLFDYLTEEVLTRQSPEVQDFLLKSAVLERLNAELVQEVTGCAQGQRLLESLEQANLFLTGLDDNRDWFRYHPLFRQYLYKRLIRQFPDEPQALHRRAAAWFARRNFLKEAVQHYLQAQSLEEAARLIEQVGQGMLMQGEVFTLDNWLNSLPPAVYRRNPGLFLTKAWIYLINLRVESAEELLQSYLAEPGNERSEMVGIQTLLALLKSDMIKVFEVAGENLENLPQDTPFWYDIKLLIEATTIAFQGNLDAASRAYKRALQSSRKNGNILVAMISLGQLGDLLLQQGQLKLATDVYKDVLALTRPLLSRFSTSTIWLGPTHLTMFEALCEWNRLEEAGFYVEETRQFAQKYEDGLLLIFSRLLEARYCLVQGHAGRALELIESIELDKSYTGTAIGRQVEYYRVQILMACDQREQVVDWLKSREASQPIAAANRDWLQQMISGKVLIYLNRPAEALNALTRCLEACVQKKMVIWAIRALVWRAIAYHRHNLLKEALDDLEQAIRLAEPHEIMRSFVDSDPSVAGLLTRLKTRPLSRSAQNYINQLLRIFSSRAGVAAKVLPEPLTGRELELLNLLQSGLTNQELAARMVISVGTVAWHLKNLYAKLEVRNRTEALSRARELNVI